MGITLTDNEIFGGLFEFELPITFVANLHITKAITDTQHCAVRIATRKGGGIWLSAVQAKVTIRFCSIFIHYESCITYFVVYCVHNQDQT